MSSRIYAVDGVSLALRKALPAALVITAQGRTQTPLWTAPALVAHTYKVPPADGVQDFDFVATPPPDDAPLLPHLTKISADTVQADIDLDGFWGEGAPLRGVRCHGMANAKTALLAPAQGMPAQPAPLDGAAALSFASDIRPLFRQIDIDRMIAVRNLDLGRAETVAEHAELILSRLRDHTMPVDGPWPARDIDLFARWITEGKAP